jgi:Zn-dependent protease
MGWSITAGSVAGTAVRIHVTFVLLLVWIFGVNYFSGGLPAAWGALVFVVLLFLCVLLHEFGHIFMARAFGVSTPDVILLPIGGVSRLERIPEKPSEEFLVAIAGPAVNVVIAVLLILFAGAKLGMDSLVSIENTSAGFIDRLAEVNLFLALFNLIPAFPMDGGRVLRALLATRFGYVRATEIAAAIGQLMTCSTPSRLGRSNIVSRSIASIMERNPRAPVLRSMAFLAMAPSASSATVRSTPSISNNC